MTEAFAVLGVMTSVYHGFISFMAGMTSKTYFFTTGKYSQDPVRKEGLVNLFFITSERDN